MSPLCTGQQELSANNMWVTHYRLHTRLADARSECSGQLRDRVTNLSNSLRGLHLSAQGVKSVYISLLLPQE